MMLRHEALWESPSIGTLCPEIERAAAGAGNTAKAPI